MCFQLLYHFLIKVDYTAFPPAPLSPLAPLQLQSARSERPAPAKPARHPLQSAVIMIIYRDLISHHEMFSDIYKIREMADRLCLEVEGKMVSRTEGNIDDSLIGGNASAEGPEGEGTESTVVTGVDIVMNHHLQETSFTKEAYKKHKIRNKIRCLLSAVLLI
uniref:Translationally-controlled tumor protein n=1 Tax=Callithrix jacchus TaxID=9483 RepID=A0A8I4A6C2_CALJA